MLRNTLWATQPRGSLCSGQGLEKEAATQCRLLFVPRMGSCCWVWGQRPPLPQAPFPALHLGGLPESVGHAYKSPRFLERVDQGRECKDDDDQNLVFLVSPFRLGP